MSTTAPGGWLEPDEVTEVRYALVRQRDVERVAGERASRAPMRGLAEIHEKHVRLLDAALKVFDGIEHGARVDALPSPEELGVQEFERRAHMAVLGVTVCRECGAPPDEPCRSLQPGCAGQRCTCGHERRWHGDWGGKGAGDCEHDGECPCGGFVAA